MTIKEADAHLGQLVRFRGGDYIITAIIKRWKMPAGLIWQVELKCLNASENSLAVCRAEEIEEVHNDQP